MQVQDRTITRALIVDDDPAARESYEYAIEELDLQPFQIEGPLDNVPGFIERIEPSDVLLCDYHLRKHSYARCDGDQLVAQCYKANVPSVLCTTFTDATLRRDYLRYIPALIKTGILEPNDLVSALNRCVSALNGDFEQSRRPWRTLVRVAEVHQERQIVYVIVPPWDVRRKIRIDMDSLPPNVRARAKPDQRFHAMVNTGAESYEELFFDSWEME